MRVKPYQLDIVIPCFREEETIPHTIPRLVDFMRGCVASNELALSSFQLVLVDDGSRDRTWEIIEELARTLPLRGIKLSRNFGHQNAMLAGLALSEADIVLTMDADLQDDLQAIPRMLTAYEQGHDLALGVRSSRGQDKLFKRLSASAHYRLLRALGVNIIHDHADFRLMSRRSLQALLAHEEVNLFLRGIVPSIGFQTKIIHYERQNRDFGATKYTLKKMLGLAINGITSFSVTPLRFAALLGAIVSLLAFVTAIWVLFVRVAYFGQTVPGWASILLPVLFLGGFQLLALGIIGEYIGKVYLEVKRRPRFIIEKTVASATTQQYVPGNFPVLDQTPRQAAALSRNSQ